MIAALHLGSLGPAPIVVDDENNRARLQAFEAAVETSGAPLRDKNQDRSLSPDEAADSDSLTQ